MRSKGSCFTLGACELRVCSLDVAEPSATVRNRPQPFATVRVIKVLQNRSFLEVSNVALLRFAWQCVALRDIQTSFVTCRKSFCVAGAILLRRFRKMRCSFRGRSSTSDVSIVILRGRSTWDVSCCVFLRIALSGLCQVATVQIPWQAWYFVACAENWRKPRTKHGFWGSKFKGS